MMNTDPGGSPFKNTDLKTAQPENPLLKSFRRNNTPALLFVWLAALTSGAVVADDAKAAVTDDSVNCLPIAQIKQTKIIDDQNIVFTTRSNKFYNNRLPRKCSGLKSADKFRYKTSQSSLCNVDIITVLQNAGSDLMDGASCGLGSFTPTTDPSKKAKAS
jgi:hypothetical protein